MMIGKTDELVEEPFSVLTTSCEIIELTREYYFNELDRTLRLRDQDLLLELRQPYSSVIHVPRIVSCKTAIGKTGELATSY